MVQIQLPFYHATLPLIVWFVVFIYGVAFKYLFREQWINIIRKSCILGFVGSLYPFLLNLEKVIYTEAPLGRMYKYYIAAFIVLCNFVLVAWGTNIVRNRKARDIKSPMNDMFFLPIPVLVCYMFYFYLHLGRVYTALIWGLITIVFVILSQGNKTGKAFSYMSKGITRFTSSRSIIIVLFLVCLVPKMWFTNHLIAEVGAAKYPYASDDGDSYEQFALAGAKDLSYYSRVTPSPYLLFYSFFISIIYKIFGHNFYMVGYLQSLMASLMVVCIYYLALWIFKERIVAFLAALILAVDQPMIQLVTTLNTEALFIPFLVFSIFFIYLFRTAKNTKTALLYAFLAGVFLGLGSIIRQVIVLIPVFILFWNLGWGRDYTRMMILYRLRDFVIIFGAMILIILPITVQNYINTHKFHLISSAGKTEWVVASKYGEDIDTSNQVFVDMGVDPFIDLKGSVVNIIRRPLDFISALCFVIPRRVRNLFLWPKFGYFDPVCLLNPSRFPNEYASILIGYFIILIIFSFGAFLMSPADIGAKLLISIPIIYYFVFHGVFFL